MWRWTAFVGSEASSLGTLSCDWLQHKCANFDGGSIKHQSVGDVILATSTVAQIVVCLFLFVSERSWSGRAQFGERREEAQAVGPDEPEGWKASRVEGRFFFCVFFFSPPLQNFVFFSGGLKVELWPRFKTTAHPNYVFGLF